LKMRGKTVLVATRNAHKVAEIRAMLGPDWEVTDLTSLPASEAPAETGNSFHANSEIKALAAGRGHTGWVLSDDSGLEVDALDGEPGVDSAIYSGPDATDASNRQKLVRELKARGILEPSAARFRCVMTLVRAGRVEAQFEGAVEGTVRPAESGEGGFGYDPMFIPTGYDQSFGELPAAVKNELSHRARALAQVIAYLGSPAAE
jgi:XTP/dITP diphosphohydrolase